MLQSLLSDAQTGTIPDRYLKGPLSGEAVRWIPIGRALVRAPMVFVRGVVKIGRTFAAVLQADAQGRRCYAAAQKQLIAERPALSADFWTQVRAHKVMAGIDMDHPVVYLKRST